MLVNGLCSLLHEDMPPFAAQLRPGGRLVCGQILRGCSCVALYRFDAKSAQSKAGTSFVLLEERDVPLPRLVEHWGAKGGFAREQSFAKTRGFA